MTTKIEWTQGDDGTPGMTWNPVSGCDRVSPGCDHCYAEAIAKRFAGTKAFPDGFQVTLHPDRLNQPFAWRKPRRVFVNSMSDLFHPQISDEFLFDVLAVMALAPRHTYQVLTKRPQRMAALFSQPSTPGRVAKAIDRLVVRQDIERMGDERQIEIDGYPGYWITDRGRVLLEGGSHTCVWCGALIAAERIARARFCSQQCNSKAHYEAAQGRWTEPTTFRPIRPDHGEQGHLRVQLVNADAEKRKELVHRLVLSAFRRSPEPGEQGCHRDGDPSNNALPNLRWGTQPDNWTDRVRHGNGRSHSKLTVQQVEEIRRDRRSGLSVARVAEQFDISETQVRNIERGDQWADRSDWPLPSLWAGASIESDRYAFRADHLRQTPAAVRFLSCEPLLGPLHDLDLTGIDWLIIGGESGPRARRMNLEWADDLVARGRAAGVAVFVKQLGAGYRQKSDPKGANPDYWPAELRIREWPHI